MKPWQQVRRKLDSVPVTEGFVGGVAPDASALYMEHYLLRGIEKTVPGISQPVFVTHFGGARVREGESGAWRSSSLPSQSLLVPAHCATHWHYSGTVDFAVFYFPDRTAGICEQVKRLAAKSKEPVQFADALVSTLALQMVKEFHKGPGKDERFITMLTPVMLEQVYRVLTTPGTTGFNPRHIHFARLQTVLAYIRDHLGENLSVPMLAQKAEVSVAHFRRLFLDAMGTSPHRYITATRLEKARTLLATTSLPITSIAEECGFSSQSHFTASFRTAHASTPAEYRTRLQQPSSL